MICVEALNPSPEDSTTVRGGISEGEGSCRYWRSEVVSMPCPPEGSGIPSPFSLGGPPTVQKQVCSLKLSFCLELIYVIKKPEWSLKFSSEKTSVTNTAYPFLFNTSHVVLGDMSDFFQKHVWITRHAMPIIHCPGWPSLRFECFPSGANPSNLNNSKKDQFFQELLSGYENLGQYRKLWETGAENER